MCMLSSGIAGLLLGKSHGWRSLVGCSPWGCEESDMTERLHFHALEKEMATHSSVFAWRIPGMAETAGTPSMGSHRVWHDWCNLAAAAAAAAAVLIFSPWLFNLEAKYIMRNAGLDQAQTGTRLLREISITSNIQMTLLLWQKVKKN